MRTSLLLFVLFALTACRVDPIESKWNLDGDGDGVVYDEDCDDTDPDRYPGADEVCDDVDNDCDGEVDEDPVDGQTWYLDSDKDGYGDEDETVQACEQPEGYVANDEDCDDDDDDINPEATDPSGDEIDQDCSGHDTVDCWADEDGDGHGTDVYRPAGDGACDPDEGQADNKGDCDDTDDTVHPGAEELCDGQLNDCDDWDGPDDPGDLPGNEVDDDDDGYVECTLDVAIEGWANDETVPVAGGGDCDDDNAFVYPGADDRCDGLQNDCDDWSGGGDPGDLVDVTEIDRDGDDYVECAFADGVDTSNWGSGDIDGDEDCNDDDDTVYPGADELCDGQLNDCNGTMLAGEVDADGDHYAVCTLHADGWDGPGTVAGGDDCDDTNATVHPGAPDRCDGLQNDCDDWVGPEDPGPLTDDTETDDDGDDYVECTFATGVDTSNWGGDDIDGDGDCDDGDDTVFPGATELCDGQLNDCDGTMLADEVDEDGDQYTGCTLDAGGWDGDGTVVGGDDCFDDDAMINPGLPELCDGGKNNDCDPVDSRTGSDLGRVSHESPAGDWSDATDDWTGTGSVDLDVDGTWHVCPATWERTLYITADDVSVIGQGDTPPVIDGRSSRRAVDVATAGTVLLRGLRLDNGDGPDGGAIRIDGDDTGAPSVDLEDVRIEDSEANEDGGGIYVTEGTVTLDADTEITSCSAKRGGGVYIADGDVTIEGAITSNTASGGDKRGGGIYMASGTLTIQGPDAQTPAEIRNNTADGDGGGIFMDTGTLDMASCQVWDNESTGDDGGGLTVETSGVVTITDCSFDRNLAADDGGAMDLDSSPVPDQIDFDLLGVSFDANHAGPDSSGDHVGGAIQVRNGALRAEACDFTNNTADGHGGAIALLGTSTVELDLTDLTGNSTVDQGGAVYCDATCDIDAFDTVFDGNMADQGGAIFLAGGLFTCDATAPGDGAVIDNTATNAPGNNEGGNDSYPGGGVKMPDATAEIDSDNCNWGSGADDDDNTPQDIGLNGFDSNWDDQSFDCTAAGCLIDMDP